MKREYLIVWVLAALFIAAGVIAVKTHRAKMKGSKNGNGVPA